MDRIMDSMNFFKSLLFLILVHGLVVIYLPLYQINGGSQIDTGLLAYLAIPLWLIGEAIVLWCFWLFSFHGQGTPLPIDPPKKLVIIGLYKYVRNPIYLGVLLLLTGHVFWFGRANLILYLLTIFLAFHTFILFYEEPTLRKKFGASYEQYLKQVPRWLPRLSKEPSRNG